MRVLVVVGHPLPGSFTHALAMAYADAAREAGAQVVVRDLAATQFPYDPPDATHLAARDGVTGHLEPEVAELVDELRAADHLVVLHPQWWGTYPATLAGWVDRTFLPGVTFRYGTGRLPVRLMAGRTARTFMTMDSPQPWNLLVYRDGAGATLGNATLRFCGYRVVGRTTFPEVRSSSPRRRARWLATATRLARRDVARLAGRHARRAAEASDARPAVSAPAG